MSGLQGCPKSNLSYRLQRELLKCSEAAALSGYESADCMSQDDRSTTFYLYGDKGEILNQARAESTAKKSIFCGARIFLGYHCSNK